MMMMMRVFGTLGETFAWHKELQVSERVFEMSETLLQSEKMEGRIANLWQALERQAEDFNRHINE